MGFNLVCEGKAIKKTKNNNIAKVNNIGFLSPKN